MNGENAQEKAERLAYIKGRQEQEVESRLTRNEQDINEVSKQVNVNSSALLDLNNATTRQINDLSNRQTKQLSEVEYEVKGLSQAVRHGFDDPDGPVRTISRQVAALTGDPIIERRQSRTELKNALIVGLVVAFLTVLGGLLIAVGHV